MSVQELLRNRKTAIAKQHARLKAGSERGAVHLLASLESSTLSASAASSRTPGPPAPASWRQARRPIHTRSHAPINSHCLVLATVPSLLSLSSETIARVLVHSHQSDLSAAISTLPVHLKQLLMQAAAKNAATGATFRMHNFDMFKDPRMQTIIVSHSNITLPALKRILPKKKTTCIPENWDDCIDRQQDSEQDEHVILSLDVSFTRIEPIPLLVKTISLQISLSTLRIASCFDAQTGPPALGVLTHSLINLVVLDVSFNVWVTRRVVQAIPIEMLGLLKVLEVVGCGGGVVDEGFAEWVVGYVCKRKRNMDVYC